MYYEENDHDTNLKQVSNIKHQPKTKIKFSKSLNNTCTQNVSPKGMQHEFFSL